ncbi:MAG TPA: PilN domain-containing protein [Thermoanaerobaculia bacterium]
MAGLLIGVLAAAAYWFVYNRALTERLELAAQRKGEAQKLESIIRDVENYQKRKDSLQSRIDLINQLKQNQKGPVRIMDQISKDLPDLVWLDTMDIVSGKITMNGRGLNPNAIANFVENIKNDPYFEEPSLNSMTQVSAQPIIYQFAMSFSFSYTPKPPAGTVATDTATTTAGGTSGAKP